MVYGCLRWFGFCLVFGLWLLAVADLLYYRFVAWLSFASVWVLNSVVYGDGLCVWWLFGYCFVYCLIVLACCDFGVCVCLVVFGV